MKRILLAALLAIPTACASLPTDTPVTVASTDAAPRAVPIESVRVVDIPVTVANIPLHTSLHRDLNPAREHIRRLMLSAS